MFSVASSMDFYSILEVDSNATTAEITASYRRLALKYHPDKNPDDVEAATEAFQKIQVAYEVLSDAEKRSYYDARSCMSTPPNEDVNMRDDYFFERLHELFARVNLFPSPFDGLRRDARERAYEAYRDERAAMDRENAVKLEEYRLRVEEEERLKRDREAAKEAKAEQEEATRNRDREVEKSKQEARWEKLGSVTKEQRLATCLHSAFCEKNQQRQKFKCDACKVKRGITAFQCPYCSSLLCQQCVVTFAKKRANPDKIQGNNPKPFAQPTPAKEPEPEPEPEPMAMPKQTPKEKGREDRGQKGRPNQGGQDCRRERPGVRRCYNCNKLGHIAKNCYWRRNGPQPRFTQETRE
ncbi:DnaJ-domain-containing protein [Annulohypoxylon stygium]|nr:DnaJ-domain-containing protein [Annulohypoxylon stygium]